MWDAVVQFVAEMWKDSPAETGALAFAIIAGIGAAIWKIFEFLSARRASRDSQTTPSKMTSATSAKSMDGDAADRNLTKNQQIVRGGSLVQSHEGDVAGRDLNKGDQVLRIDIVRELHIHHERVAAEKSTPSGHTEAAVLAPGPAPTLPGKPIVSIARLPVTGKELFGREEQLAALEAAWGNPATNVISIVAPGGVGKSALVNHWLDGMCADGWRGAERVYGWSFYSQGARRDGTASADAFIGQALADFGDGDPDAGSPFQKGERLARLIRGARTLLVLDGLEPLQDPSDGRLRDPALASVLRELAADNPGLCVATTRQRLADLESHPKAAPEIDLETLNEDAGARYLRSLGVTGNDGELRAASREFGGHALALKLLGNFLREAHGGDAAMRRHVALLEEDAAEGGHAWRGMASYEARLNPVEAAAVRLLGLLDRPADRAAVAALRRPPAIPGLTEELTSVADAVWNRALTRLRDAGLVAADDGSGALDAHPLVREYFARRLREEAPKAWRDGNGRLFDYFKDSVEDRPDTREGLEPLFAAVIHGCRAGRFRESYDDVLKRRIDRLNEAFAVKKLGLFGSRLGALAGFFDVPWSKPLAALPKNIRASMLHEAGFCLRALGRLADAEAPMIASLKAQIDDLEVWENAAIAASNLSQLRLNLGFVAAAISDAERAVDYADRSGVAFQRMTKRVALADALAQTGRTEEAERVFELAEAMQKQQQPDYPFLFSFQGFLYCDLLLDLGGAVEVRERVGTTLEWTRGQEYLLDIALDQLSLGRATAALGEAGATVHLDAAVDCLRQAGTIHHLPRGLLARADFRRRLGDRVGAVRDLREALDIAERIGARLFEADARLGFAQLEADGGDIAAARNHLEAARKLVADTGYHRRDRDLVDLDAQLAGN